MGKKKEPKTLIYFTLLCILGILLLSKSFFLFSETGTQALDYYDYMIEIDGSFGEQSPGSIFQQLHTDKFRFYSFAYGLIYEIFSSLQILKFLEIIIFGLIFYLIYLISRDLTKNDYASIFTVILAGTIPMFFYDHQSPLVPENTVILLILSIIYFLLKSSIFFDPSVEDKTIKNIIKTFHSKRTIKYFKNSYILILTFLSIIAAFYNEFILLLVSALLIYLIFSYIENYSEKIYVKEFSIFFILLITESYLFFNREIIEKLKVQSIWGNIPIQITENISFQEKTLMIFILLGIIISLGGIYSIYYFFNEKKLHEHKKIIFYMSAIFSSLLFYFLDIGNKYILITFIGIMFSLCFGAYINRQIIHADRFYKIKLSERSYWLIAYFLIIIAGLSIHYSLIYSLEDNNLNEISSDSLDALTWMKDLPDNSLIIAPYQYGHAINYIAKKKVVLNSDFIEIENTNFHYKELQDIYTNINSIKVQEILNRYSEKNITHIYIYYDDTVGKIYDIEKPFFSYDQHCFKKIYQEKDTSIYSYECDRK